MTTEDTKAEQSSAADPQGRNEAIVMRNPGGMREAVKSLSEYWVTYSEQEGYEDYRLETLLDDCLYGIGIAVDPEGYAYAQGYRKFKEDLKAWLGRA